MRPLLQHNLDNEFRELTITPICTLMHMGVIVSSRLFRPIPLTPSHAHETMEHLHKGTLHFFFPRTTTLIDCIFNSNQARISF